MNIRDLNDVVRYLTEKAPELELKRGQTTCIEKSRLNPANNYEVVQVFCNDWDNNGPIAEFWKGYYKKKPKICTGFFGPQNSHYFKKQGDLNSIITEIMKEKKRIEICPKIIKALESTVKINKTLKSIYQPIFPKDITACDDGKSWLISCESFRCKANQRCTMTVEEVDNSCFYFKYQLETWQNNKYELDSAGMFIIAI